MKKSIKAFVCTAAVALGLTAFGAKPGLLVFDCDPGTDDSVAMFLMAKAGVKPDVIVSTYGNMPGPYTLTNAWLMANSCGFADSSMLVAGARKPTIGPDPTCGDFHGADGFAGLAAELTQRYGNPVVTNTLDDVLARIKAAENVTYIAVGPLTSLSQLLDKDPSITNHIGSTLIMGGGIKEFNKEVGTKDLEYNFAADGIAVTNVFASGLPITLFPLDITHHHADVAKSAIDMFSASGRYPELCQILRTNYASNAKYTPGIDWAVLHDTLPVLYHLDPKAFKTDDLLLKANEYGHIDVSAAGRPAKVGVSLPDGYLKSKLMTFFSKTILSVY